MVCDPDGVESLFSLIFYKGLNPSDSVGSKSNITVADIRFMVIEVN